MVACDRCAKNANRDDDAIQCMGFCDLVFHLKCISVSTSFLRLIKDRNVFWMCDECAKLMKLVRFKDAVSSLGSVVSIVIGNQHTGISELKDELAKNNEQVAQIKEIVNSSTPRFATSYIQSRPPKRRRDEIPAKPSTGTRIIEGNEALVAPPPPSLYWVYLSRFHPSVKSDAVEKVVRDGLQCVDPIKVVPLLKRGADTSTLSYVSYKVGVPLELKNKALDPVSWPAGILFREFEDNQRTTGWLPPIRSVSPSTPFGTPAPFGTLTSSLQLPPTQVPINDSESA